MTTADRLDLLASCADLFAPWTGPFDATALRELIASDFGDPHALDTNFDPTRNRRIRIPDRLLHVVSENTPHAAFQSLLRGLILGSVNHIKIPSAGLPAFEQAVSELPEALTEDLLVYSDVPFEWLQDYETIIVYGSDQTIAWFEENTPPEVRLVLHGTRLSIALVTDDPEGAAPLAAKDVSLFDQRGCLSVHDVYVDESGGLRARDFAVLLADAMDDFNRSEPRSALGPSAAGAITTLRETVRFVAASKPDEVALWESAESTDWTVIYESDPSLKLSPLNRVVYVKPWPKGQIAAALGPNLRFLSTLALHPFDPACAEALSSLRAHRLCPLGTTQNPPLTWHQDRYAPLASLVTFVAIDSAPSPPNQ